MKYMKRADIYQASNYNVTFSLTKIEAWSYRWWAFVKVIEGKIIFNSYRYSNSTSKHQSKVRSLMSQLGVDIGMFVHLRSGLQSINSLSELYLAEEESQCDMFLAEELKRQERNAKASYRRKVRKLEDYLENSVAFRDYDIVDRSRFGKAEDTLATKVAVHQVVDNATLEKDVENALYNFHRDGFGRVVFYV